MEKSELPLVGREDNLELASKLGCWVGKFPFAYLSLPLGALFKPTTMWDVVEEKFQKSLVFPKGRGILGVWVLLADKLRSLAVALHSEDKVGLDIVGAKERKRGEAQAEEEEKNRSFVEVAKAKAGRIEDAVWLQLGGRALRSREEQLGHCLVGKWEAEAGRRLDLDCLRTWGRRLWNLKWGVCFSFLGGGFFLAEFEVAEEAERVLRRRNRRFQDRILHLERWGPEACCFQPRVHADQCWVRAVGLPLNFKNQEVFNKLGDSCGGLVVVDGDTTNFTQLQWARLLVKTDGKNLPRSLHVVVGSLCFTIQLWWEVPPWQRGTFGIQGAVRAIEEDKVEQVGVVSIEYGLGMAGGTEASEGNDGKGKGVVEVSGDGSEGVVLKGKGNGLSAHWAESVKRGNIKLLGAHEVCQQSVGLRESLAQKGHRLSSGGLEDSGLRVSGQPICQEGLAQLDNVEGLKRVRAPISSCVESRLVEAIVGAMPLVVVKEKNGANEALLEEASRYPHSETFSFLSFGSQHPSSSSSSSSSFCGGKKRYGRESEAPFVLEKGVTEFEGGEMPTKVVEKVLEEEDKSVLGSWMNGNFVNFADVWVIEALTKGQKVDLVCLQETKMQEMSRMIVRSLSVRRCLDWKALNSRGASSGVLVFWDKRGGSFTWKGGLNNQSHSRIDRWGGLRGGLMPFRFENMWLKEKGFKEKVQAWWDKVELTQPLSVQEVDARSGAKEDFKKWVLLEEISWRQKSREVRLREGDRNTSFFFKIANAHRRRNLLSRVKINGSWLTEENEVRNGVMNEFKLLLSTVEGWRPCIRGMSFKRLEPVVATRLEEPFSEQEMLETLKGFCGDKASGPDGFTMAF
ncbi:hypothetical protein CK203_006499 [Vitis vinifera]|uniref:DUF4283 domain-containing protein n=1 Tax=Vitis vinifera TaxID=29760 RepID=A0A438KBS4_VITVI|nr:hypothetical protein CK203_006499 [Vitis vinifera]